MKSLNKISNMFTTPIEIFKYIWIASFKDISRIDNIEMLLTVDNLPILLNFNRTGKKSTRYISKLIVNSNYDYNSFFNDNLNIPQVFDDGNSENNEKYTVEFIINYDGKKYLLCSLEDIKPRNGIWSCNLNLSHYLDVLENIKLEKSKIGKNNILNLDLDLNLEYLIKNVHKVAYYLHINVIYCIDFEKENNVNISLIKEISNIKINYIKFGYLPVDKELYNYINEKIDTLKKFIVDDKITIEYMCNKCDDIYSVEDIGKVFNIILENINIDYVYYDCIIQYKMITILYYKIISVDDI